MRNIFISIVIVCTLILSTINPAYARTHEKVIRNSQTGFVEGELTLPSKMSPEDIIKEYKKDSNVQNKQT